MASAGVNAGAGDHQTDIAFRDTFNQFKKKISDINLQKIQEGSEMNLKYKCFSIQRDQERRGALTNLRRIEQFLFRLKELEIIMKDFRNGESYVSHIWGTMDFLISTANSTLTDGWDGLLSAYEDLGKAIPALKGLEPLFSEATGLRTCLVALYSDILDFHAGVYRCFTQFSDKGRKRIFKSAWDEFKKYDFAHLESRLRKLKRIVEYGERCLRNQQPTGHGRFLSQDHIEKLNDKVLDYEIDRDKEEKEHDRTESDRRKTQLETALQWILVAGQDTSQQCHEELCEEREKYPGTCDWIDDVECVSNWLNEPASTHPILWINGNYGTGKSTLASYLVDKCRKTRPSFQATYFYCKEDNPAASAVLSICRGLLRRQIMHVGKDEKFRHLIAHCCEKKDSSGQPQLLSGRDAESLLRTFFEIMPDQFIIVDGLDECEKPVIREALKILCSVVGQQDSRLRLLIISRDLVDIKRPLSAESVNAKIFSIEAKDNAKAIRLYVDLRLTNFDPAFKLSDKEKDKIKERTVVAAEGAQGMFLFARLTLDHLADSMDRSKLFDRLKGDHFPKDIRQAFLQERISYENLLESLKKSLTLEGDEEPWNKAKLIFGWLICAERPLHWHEIRCIASIDREYESVELQDKGFIYDVQRFCGTLVHVRRGDKVELIHHTARRYILDSKHVDKQEVLFDLATLCMQYLTFPCFERGLQEPNRKTHARKGDYAFQDYAVSKWFYHIAEVVKIQTLTVDKKKSETFAKVLDNFTNRYEESFDDMDSPPSSAASESNPVNLEEVKELARKECASLEESEFYELLLNLWVHVSKHEKETTENRNKPCLKELEKVLLDNRKVIEDLSEALGAAGCQDLHDFYGENLYKCPRVRCGYFHEGLKDAKQRKRHISQHDRPFSCAVPNCSLAEAGFTNGKDLDKHRKTYHSDLVEGQAPFPPRNNRQSNEAKFDCRICEKRFTRKINLDGHTRSHFGDRPYSCQACDKKFTRLNDLRRHEKLHVRGSQRPR